MSGLDLPANIILIVLLVAMIISSWRTRRTYDRYIEALNVNKEVMDKATDLLAAARASRLEKEARDSENNE